jgi:hypothetical protein
MQTSEHEFNVSLVGEGPAAARATTYGASS